MCLFVRHIGFKVAAILKSNMADKEAHFQVEIGTIGFLDPKNILLDTKTKSIARVDPEILAVKMFRWWPF
jgi:hypothetical protein